MQRRDLAIPTLSRRPPLIRLFRIAQRRSGRLERFVSPGFGRVGNGESGRSGGDGVHESSGATAIFVVCL